MLVVKGNRKEARVFPNHQNIIHETEFATISSFLMMTNTLTIISKNSSVKHGIESASIQKTPLPFLTSQKGRGNKVNIFF